MTTKERRTVRVMRYLLLILSPLLVLWFGDCVDYAIENVDRAWCHRILCGCDLQTVLW